MQGRRLILGLTVPMSVSLIGPRLSGLLELGWDVHLVVGEPIQARYLPDPRITVHVLPMKRSISPVGDLVALVRWILVIGKVRPSHVWAATPKASFLGILAARIRRTPHRIFEVWGLRWDGLKGWKAHVLRACDRISCAFATDVIAVSTSLAERMQVDGVAPQTPRVLGSGATKGVAIDRFFPRAQSREGYSLHRPRVGFLARLAHDKGVDDLIAVADMVHSALRDVEFVLAGDWDDADPPSMATKQSLLSRPYLKRVGHVDDASTYLRSISVLCFPSHREGLPNAVIEAAACGVPTVGWDVTGTRDAIVNARTGYLISKGDHRAMASAIVNLLTDASLLLAMGNAAHAFSLERFSEETVVAAFLEYLNSTVAE